MNNRENIFNKVRALLSKTVDNGCTEAEAMTALMMAEKLMAAHEIDESDLKLEDETAVTGVSNMSDPQNIRKLLAYWIGKFTDTYTLLSGKDIKIIGLKSDVDFALWLLETLSRFVKRQLKEYMWANGYQSLQGNERIRYNNSFVRGCCSRINTRLKSMIDERQVTTNSTALVVAKQALINDVVKNMNIRVSDNRGRKAALYRDIYGAGQSAGDKASFGRPVSQGGMLRIGCK